MDNTLYLPKLLSLCILNIAAFSLFGAISHFITTGSWNLFLDINSSTQIALAFLASLFLVCLFSYCISTFPKSLWESAVGLASGPIGYIAGFLIDNHLENGLALASISGLFISLVLVRFMIYVRMEYRNSIRINLTTLLPKNFQSLLNMLGVAIAINYYLIFNAQFASQNFQVPQILLNKIVEPVVKMTGQKISSEVPQALLMESITTQTKNIISSYGKFIPIILAFSLFFSLETIFSILPGVITAFVKIVIYLLKKVRFVNLDKSTVEIERYTL